MFDSVSEHFKTPMDRAVDDREVALVRRRSGGAVAMIAANELQSLMETAHLLRSPKNADRLLADDARPNGYWNWPRPHYAIPSRASAIPNR